MNRYIPGFPDLQINNIFCIGRNYHRHIEELGNRVPDEPLVFLKPNSAVIFNGDKVVLPGKSSEVHHEVELVILIGKEGKNIPPEEACQYIKGIAVGIDFTARDIQSEARKDGRPWSIAKGFDTFAPVSSFVDPADIPDVQELKIELSVNNLTRQKGTTSHMIFGVNDLISFLSSNFTLQPGDLVYTGTPEGVGSVKSGDRLLARLNDNLITLEVDVQ